MTLEEIKKEADAKRHDAKWMANALFKIPEGSSSGAVEAMIDDIITCAILEITAIQKEAISSAKFTTKPSKGITERMTGHE